MWEYEKRPKIWADINLVKKTFLYPHILGEEYMMKKAGKCGGL